MALHPLLAISPVGCPGLNATLATSLLQRSSMPAAYERWLFPAQDILRAFIFAGTGQMQSTPLHYHDEAHIPGSGRRWWMLQTEGRKEWYLFDRRDAPQL